MSVKLNRDDHNLQLLKLTKCEFGGKCRFRMPVIERRGNRLAQNQTVHIVDHLRSNSMTMFPIAASSAMSAAPSVETIIFCRSAAGLQGG